GRQGRRKRDGEGRRRYDQTPGRDRPGHQGLQRDADENDAAAQVRRSASGVQGRGLDGAAGPARFAVADPRRRKAAGLQDEVSQQVADKSGDAAARAVATRRQELQGGGANASGNVGDGGLLRGGSP